MASGISNTTDISWIRLAITAKYPDIMKNKGADLDGNGKIDEKEKFGDLDHNGTVDDKDFWLYLNRNRTSISDRIDFFKWQGKNISDDNIINTLLFIESQICKNDTQKAYKRINEIIANVKGGTYNKEDPERVLKSLYFMLQTDFSIIFEDQEDPLFTNNLLNGNGKLDCDTMTFLFLAIAHECKWPLLAVNLPEHTLMRWNVTKIIVNFDYGIIDSDKNYQKGYNIDESSIKNGVYLKDLTQNELIGMFYANRGLAKDESGDHAGALRDHNEAARHYPNNAEVYYNRAPDKFELGDFEGAIKDYDKTIELDPNYVQAYFNRGTALQKIGLYKRAIKDFSKVIDLDSTDADAYHSRASAEAQTWHWIASIRDSWKESRIKRSRK